MKNREKIRNMTHIALYSIMLTVCSWLSVPLAVPITLQTFGVFFILFYAGGKKALASLLLYIALGAIGLPVFSGFGNGMSVLVGPTGGYILGFLAAGAVYFAAEAIFKEGMSKRWVKYCVATVALFACYALGALGVIKYASDSALGYFEVFFGSVAAYGIADALKIVSAELLCSYIRKYVKA